MLASLARFHIAHVRQHLGVVHAGDGGRPGRDAGGHDDLVELDQIGRLDPRVELEIHTVLLNHLAEVADSLEELLLAGHHLGHVELAANLSGLVEERDVVPALGGSGREGQAGGSGADDRDGLLLRSGGRNELVLVARLGVDEAGRRDALESVVEAGLVIHPCEQRRTAV